MEKRARLAVQAFLIVVLAAGFVAAEELLHLKLDKSIPEADQVVSEAPTKIVLDFSQKPEVSVSRIRVTSDHGDAKLTAVASGEEDETILWAAFEEPLADGVYAVSWVTSSGDGHPIRGEFSFTVNAGR
jgi:methionine-rich copper-binding protein CopC